MNNIIGKKATYNNLHCKVVKTFVGPKSGRVIAEVVYSEVKAGAESINVAWGKKRYNVYVDNLVF